MRILQLKPHLTTSELSGKLSACSSIHLKNYWKILLSVSFNPSKKADEYASFLGVTKSKVYKVVELYNREGACFTENLNWGGRRSKTSHMSFKEEGKMMNDLKTKAKNGKIIIAKHIQKIVETKLGKSVSDDYVWDLFNRHNWEKKIPHPKHSKATQKKLKINLQKCWQPNQ